LDVLERIHLSYPLPECFPGRRLFQVFAGTKSPAGTGQDDRFDLGILAGDAQLVNKPLQQVDVNGIEALGPIELQNRDALFFLEIYGFFLQSMDPFWCIR
jgi:hypothetical protein